LRIEEFENLRIWESENLRIGGFELMIGGSDEYGKYRKREGDS
jgi:hypothetical protein